MCTLFIEKCTRLPSPLHTLAHTVLHNKRPYWDLQTLSLGPDFSDWTQWREGGGNELSVGGEVYAYSIGMTLTNIPTHFCTKRNCYTMSTLQQKTTPTQWSHCKVNHQQKTKPTQWSHCKVNHQQKTMPTQWSHCKVKNRKPRLPSGSIYSACTMQRVWLAQLSTTLDLPSSLHREGYKSILSKTNYCTYAV